MKNYGDYGVHSSTQIGQLTNKNKVYSIILNQILCYSISRVIHIIGRIRNRHNFLVMYSKLQAFLHKQETFPLFMDRVGPTFYSSCISTSWNMIGLQKGGFKQSNVSYNRIRFHLDQVRSLVSFFSIKQLIQRPI